MQTPKTRNGSIPWKAIAPSSARGRKKGKARKGFHPWDPKLRTKVYEEVERVTGTGRVITSVRERKVKPVIKSPERFPWDVPMITVYKDGRYRRVPDMKTYLNE